MKRIFTVFFVLFSFVVLKAQTTLHIEWDKTFGDKKNQSACSVMQNNDYEIVIAAEKSMGVGWYLWMLKTDMQGNLIIEHSEKGVYTRDASIAQTSDKGYVSLGFGNGADGNFISLVKFDRTLNNQWKKSLKSAGDNLGMKVISTSDGGYMVLGNSKPSENSGKYIIDLYKIDASGNQQWKKSFDNYFKNYGVNLIQTIDNGYVIVANVADSEDGYDDILVIKTDINGNSKWEQRIGGDAADMVSGVLETTDGFLIVGTTVTFGNYGRDGWVIKFDKNGNKVWNKTYGGTQADELEAIVKDGDGFVLGGSTKSSGAGKWDFWVFRIDKMGNLQWEKTFGGSLDEKLSDIAKTFDGGFVAVGSTKSKGAGKKDLWVVKMNFSIRDRAKNYVETKVNAWQQKGAYEKLDDYKKRVTVSTRQQKITEFTNEFFGQIGVPIFNKVISNASFEYDSESEIFKISMQYFNPMYIPVPIDEAPEFDKNFSKLEYSDMKFNLTSDDKLEIYQATIKNPANDKTYFYDGSKLVVFNSLTIDNNFSPVEIIPSPTNDPALDDNTQVVVGQSDVDVNIPDNNFSNNNRYALIIGNAHYIEHGSDMVDILYSINDAKIFKQYAVKVLGVPDNTNHIYYVEDANATYIKLYIDNFSKLIQSKPAGSEFYVYYSGHGTQDAQNESYLVPVGVTSDYIEQFAIKLDDFYTQLSPGADKKVYVFLDACFSGGGKNGQLLVNAKTGLYRPPKDDAVSSNLVVFAASSEKEISQEYLEMQHGLFTYFLLKNLQTTKGNLTFGDLYNKVKDDVNTTVLNPQNKLKIQTPSVNVNPSIQNTWKVWKVNP